MVELLITKLPIPKLPKMPTGFDFSRSDLNPNNWEGDAGGYVQVPMDTPTASPFDFSRSDLNPNNWGDNFSRSDLNPNNWGDNFSRSDLNPNNWGGDVGEYLQRPMGTPTASLITGAIVGFATGGLGFGAAGAGAFYGGAVGGYIGLQQTNSEAFARQQQNLINQQIAQQERLMRDEQNRRWQQEISNSWAAYGAQLRAQFDMGGGGVPLGPMSANDLYLGGR